MEPLSGQAFPTRTARFSQLVTREVAQLNVHADTIARACSSLVSELVEKFKIVEVGSRPPIGGKAPRYQGEWTIGDLVLPFPRDFSVCTFSILFIRLLCLPESGYIYCGR